jgi:hypothetical protein
MSAGGKIVGADNLRGTETDVTLRPGEGAKCRFAPSPSI